MKTKYDWNEIVDQFYEAVGGKENIVEVYHCASRLRFRVKNEKQIKKSKLKNIPLAKGINVDGDEYQIIFGAGTVNKVYTALMASNKNVKSEQKVVKTFKWDSRISKWSNLGMNSRAAVRWFSSIFLPLIPALIAGGLSLGIMSFINAFEPTSEAGKFFATFFDKIGGTILSLLPAFIVWSVVKKMGGNQVIGLAVGLLVVAPTMAGLWTNYRDFKTMELIPGTSTYREVHHHYNSLNEFADANGYSFFHGFANGFFTIRFIRNDSQVIVALVAGIMTYWIERGIKKISHESVAVLTIPLFTVILSYILILFIVGPIGRIVGLGIGDGLSWMYLHTNTKYFGFGGLLLGVLLPPLVITGFHQALWATEWQIGPQLKGEIGHQSVFVTPIGTVADIAIGVAVLTIIVLISNKKARAKISSIAIPGGVSANLGITEPALFGVAIPLKYPLYAAMGVSGILGCYIGMLDLQANTWGSASWIGLVQFDWTDQYFYGNTIYDANTMTWGSSAMAAQSGIRGWVDATSNAFFPSYVEYKGIDPLLPQIAPGIHMAYISAIAVPLTIGSTFGLSRLKTYKQLTKDFELQYS